MAFTPAWFAFRVVSEGISANAALRMAQEAGLGVRRASFLRMVGEIREHYSGTLTEPTLPLNRRPTALEAKPLHGGKARGYFQYVDLFVRNRTTGLVSIRPQALRTSTLLSRQQVIDRMTGRYRSAIDKSKTAPALWGTDPDEVIIGAVYTATQRLIPE